MRSMSRPLLEASSITFGYPGSRPIINEWSGSFLRGEVVALTGASGRGKSTLLYLLGLMVRPKSGLVLVDETETTSLPDWKRAHLRATRFGFVFQDAALDSTRTVLDNILESSLYRGESRSKILERALLLMRQLGVDLRASGKPGQVSGGQAQRVALCRALLGDPQIILADEPTGNLDRFSAAIVIEALEDRANNGCSVVIATHDPELVARCDRAITI